MHRYSPPRKLRRGDWCGDDDFSRRSRSKWDKTDLPPPPDVVGVPASSSGHMLRNDDTSSHRDDGFDDAPVSFGEGRGRFDRSEPVRTRSRRSPDRYESRDEYSDSYDDESWDVRGRDQPTDTVILKGLPDDFRERDVRDLVHGIRGVKDIRMVSRRRGRDGGPMAFIEFLSVEHCMTAEERWLRDRLDEERLFRVSCEFAQPLGSNRVSDWVCNVCRTLNFSRRDECIKCRSDRDWRGDSPTRTICVSNVDPDFTEDDLKILVAEHGVAQDVRLVRSRSGAWTQYGIAYITFATTGDAEAAKQAITGAKPAGQRSPIEAAFAQDRGAQKASMASQAVAAAAAMNAYNSSRREDTSSAKPGEHGGWKPREIPQEDSVAAASAVPEVDAAAAPGFIFDEASGYYYDAGTGYYYDAKTQLYYHPTTQSWYRHNNQSGEYDVIPAESTAPASERSETTAADTARHSDAAATARVINSRPELDAQGLLSLAASAKPTSPICCTDLKTTEKASKPSTGQADMVSAWLQRKAEEQRKAARDFLKKPEGKSSRPVAGNSDQKESCIASTAAGGSVSQSSQALVAAEGVDTIIKHVAGGVVRGKVYSKKAF